jgi:hypothetical protein
MHDEVLGTLTWSESTDSWICSVVAGSGVSVNTSLIPLGQDVGPLIDHARVVIDEFVERDRRWRRVAADCLLPDYLENWSNGRAMDADEFMNSMSLDRVGYWPKGKAEAWYFDGGLFGGHLIVIPFRRDGTIDEPYIAG